jgi:hypothetical protein
MPLFRPDVGVAAGAAGRRDYRRVAGIGGRRANFGIDARGWAQDAVRPCQLVTEWLASLPGRRALRHLAAGRSRLYRRAVTRGLRCGRCRRRRWRRRRGRRLRDGGARCRRHNTPEKNRVFHSHGRKTAGPPGGSDHYLRICGSGSARNAPSVASVAVRPG